MLTKAVATAKQSLFCRSQALRGNESREGLGLGRGSCQKLHPAQPCTSIATDGARERHQSSSKKICKDRRTKP